MTSDARCPKAVMVGAGMVGAGWGIVFARAGWTVALYDEDPHVAEQALITIDSRLNDLERFGLLSESTDAVLNRITVEERLAEALKGARYVQESVSERCAIKRAVHQTLEEGVDANCLLASSTSTFNPSELFGGLASRARCLVVHPVNPPYLVPLVEIVPAEFTSSDTVDRTLALMRAVGQTPVLLLREIQGFLLNRLQWTLFAEACRLVTGGYASLDDVDATIRLGLGLRWSFMGPFEVGDLNAPNGLKDYLCRFGTMIEAIDASSESAPRGLSSDDVSRLDAERRKLLPVEGLSERRQWRDRRLMALRAHQIRGFHESV